MTPLSKAAIDIWNNAVTAWRPPPKLTLSEWADTYAYLSPESSAEAGKWRSLPYQVGIMDAFSDATVERITLIKSARVGYTKIINHAIGYHVHQDPCPILVVQPTIEDAEGYSKDEVSPMLRDTPCLAGLVADARTRDSNNTILKKSYPGGNLIMVGANSPRGFRRISARIVLFDEVDAYPPSAGAEGDQIMLGIRRTEYYWNRKIVLGSTPTVSGLSRIEDSFNQSDQRRYFVPCPYCGYMQFFKWQGLTWPKGKPEQAAYECESCEKLIPHSQKRWMVERGEWRATRPFSGHAGFHIWAAYSYSPNATWAKLAGERESIGKNREKLKTFINTVLGECWEDRGSQPAWEGLHARCEPYRFMKIPAPAYLLTAGIDVQHNRLACVVRAWGKGEESWLIYWGELFGNPAEPAVWRQLDGLLQRSYPHASGAQLRIVAAAIDSGGHSTQPVYNYCRTRAPVAFPIKGQSQAGKPIIGRPTPQDVAYGGSKIKGGIQLWPVGSDTAKSTIYSRLQQAEGQGVYHWPIGLDAEYFQQLTAEKQITKYHKGYPKTEWVKTGPRNEALDCEVYAYAAAIRAGLQRLNFDQIEEQFKQPATPAPAPQRSRPQVVRRPQVARSNWMMR